jgi:hypothetical protein
MATLIINPSSESELIDLIKAKELNIEKIEEGSDNQDTIEHHIIFFVYKDISRPAKTQVLKQKKYDDIPDYIQFKIKNINPRFSVKVEYSIIEDDINPEDYDSSKLNAFRS